MVVLRVGVVMYAALHALLVEPVSSSGEMLEGISGAFSAALDGRPSAIALASLGVVGVCSVVVLVVRHRREVREEAELSAHLEEQAHEHEAALAELSKRVERRKWLRAPAHVPMRVLHLGPHDSLRIEELETQNLGGGGVAFLTHRPPHVGTHLDFILVLAGHETRVHGVVLRVEPGASPKAPSLVALRFGDIENAARERVIHVVAEESRREHEREVRGRACKVCHRPLASDTEEAHATCQANEERIVSQQFATTRSMTPPSDSPKRRVG